MKVRPAVSVLLMHSGNMGTPLKKKLRPLLNCPIPRRKCEFDLRDQQVAERDCSRLLFWCEGSWIFGIRGTCVIHTCRSKDWWLIAMSCDGLNGCVLIQEDTLKVRSAYHFSKTLCGRCRGHRKTCTAS